MSTTRNAYNTLEVIHAMIYFAPEAEQRLTQLGLPGTTGYFASRAAAMGAVGPGVVAATFYSFNPTKVAEAIPHAWTKASPETILTARFAAAEDALKRMLGAELFASEVVTEAARLAREAVAACTPEARPLYAAHADLDWPQNPALQLWHSVTLLREYRGDGHLWALQRAGLTGIQANVLQNAAGAGLTEGFVKRTRGWSDVQWSGAQNSLRERGLLDETGAITTTGEHLRETIETETDEVAHQPWTLLGTDKASTLLEQGGGLARKLLKAGAIPRDMLAAD